MNKNTSHILVRSISFLTTFLLLHSLVHAEFTLGDKGAITVGADADLRYDSNISANSNEDGDTIATALPKILYRYNQGIVLVDAFVGVEFVEYDEQSQFDSQNFKSRLELSYPSDAAERSFSWKLKTGFNESTTADSDLQSIVERERFDFDLTARYYVADRYYIRSGFEYRDEEIVTEGFNDVLTLSVPIDFYYAYSENLSFGLGVEFSDVEIDGPGSPTADSSDTAYYVAAEGRLLSNLVAEIKVGVESRDFDDSAFEDAEMFFLEGALRWSYSDRTSFELNLANGFRNTARNQSIEESSVVLTMMHELDEKIVTELSAGYSESDFESLGGVEVRRDETWSLEWGVSYELIEDQLSLDFALSYSDQSSDAMTADYEDSAVKFGISYTY
ncbi:outer membrane beta-barrel protein [Coraliomargarita sp. W4R53]